MSHQARGGAATRRWRCEMSGFTVVPRWTLKPVPGVGEYEVRIPDELMAASRRLANDLAVPLSSVLLAAHAKVLGAFSGEREVCAGYAVENGPPLPIRMTLGSRSWREAVQDIARAESDLLAHSDVSHDDLQNCGSADIPVRSNMGSSSGVRTNGMAGLSRIAADRNVRAPAARGPGLTDRLFETLFELSAGGGGFPNGTILR